MNTNPTNTAKQMMVQGKGILGNAKQKMNQLSSQAQAEYHRTLGALNKEIGNFKGKLSEAQQTALTELKTQKANLQNTHKELMKGYDPNDTGATFMNGFNQAVAKSKEALKNAKTGVKSAQKFTKDAKQAYKNTVKIGTPATVGGRKRRTRRKRRKKGRKSRRKGRKSRRSRRKKRKGRKSRRKKRRTRRHR